MCPVFSSVNVKIVNGTADVLLTIYSLKL